MQTEVQDLGRGRGVVLFNSNHFLFFISVSVTEADIQDSGVVSEHGQPSSSPEEMSEAQPVCLEQ